MKRVTLFGLPFIAAKNHDGVVEEVLAWPLKKEHPQELPLLSTPNVDQVVKLHRKEHAELLGHIARARFVLPDGQPIVWVGNRKKGCELPARLAGSDLFPAVWNKLAARKSPIFMVLANDAIGEALRKENPEMHWLTPPFYSIADPKAEQQVVDAVFDALIARPVPLVFLGLGFPKQERLALALIEKLKAVAAPIAPRPPSTRWASKSAWPASRRAASRRNEGAGHEARPEHDRPHHIGRGRYAEQSAAALLQGHASA
jgi:N-acetylglucosaminyldiphosphoundecaprenol N-acetyl-beta-D-mannosaminyltransferase